jgi:DNA-directed RNA polymerase subunit omega
MMRLEETLSQALERVNNDRYRLSVAVGQRADELSKGAKPLIDISLTKNMKFTDIAIEEIATGALIIESIE